jgi:hypothetical protein
MNIPNLLKMAEYIATVPQEMFDMKYYRERDDFASHKCNSVGCVLGHCTVLDKAAKLPKHFSEIDFVDWSEGFTGIGFMDNEWNWCFHGMWNEVDNTPIGASKRIKYLIEHGLPENWREQMNGEAPLSY